jgi:hypothetical protein
MKKLVGLAVGLALFLGSSGAYAWSLSGRVFCDGAGLPLGGITITVTSTDGGGFSGSATSDETGYYFVALPNSPGCYEAKPSLGIGESIVSPASGSFAFCATDQSFEFQQNWVISSPACVKQGCWLTGGGAKFSTITNTLVGVSIRTKTSKEFNWGGNVNPGCSPTAGEGGQWNTIDTGKKLHFQGFAIQVVRCGNVDGIPPGSTSPATPYNFIEFKGTGRVKGIQGNKADYPLVYFFARAEDRNEPGSEGQRDGAGKDRYFLNVYTDPSDPSGSSIILVDDDGNPGTVDPLTITDGNMQIHVSSCGNASPTQLANTNAGAGALVEASSKAPVVSFAAPSPNPTFQFSILRYALTGNAKVSLTIYDVAGRMVRDLVTGTSSAGHYAVTWNLRNQSGEPVSGGVYFARLIVNGEVSTRNIIVSH